MSLYKVGLVQMAPVWLNKEETLKRVLRNIERASEKGLDLVVFGEVVVPGYPFWVKALASEHACDSNSVILKDMYAHYLKEVNW